MSIGIYQYQHNNYSDPHLMVLTTKWSINHGGDCRTSPATPGLLIIGKLFNLFKRLFGLEKTIGKYQPV